MGAWTLWWRSPAGTATSPASTDGRTRALALALALVLALAAGGCGPKGGSEGTLVEGHHDFGPLRHGQRASHTFVVTPSAPRSFHVRAVVTECTCAWAVARAVEPGGASRETAPYDHPSGPDDWILEVRQGERLELDVVVDTNLRSPVDSGPIPFTSWMVTDLPGSERLSFQSGLNVVAPVLVRPGPLVDLGGVGDRQRATAVLDLLPRPGEEPFDVVSVEGELEGLVVERVEAAGDAPSGAAIRFRIESPPGRPFGPDGRLLRRLSFRTTADGGYTLPVAVTATRLPPFSVFPQPKISFGRIEMEGGGEGRVLVRPNVPGDVPGLEPRVLEVQADGTTLEDPWRHFHVEVEPLQGSRDVQVTVRYTGGLDARGFRGRLQLATGDPEQAVVEIELVAFRL